MRSIVVFTILVLTFSVFLSIKSVDAVEFVDHTGYIPSWASGIGGNQASSVCINVEYGTTDNNWCSEFSGYRLDQMLGTKQVTFKDHTGYIPNWAKSIGENQASSACISMGYGTKDGTWCSEFSGYRLDQMLDSNKKTQTNEKSDKTKDKIISKEKSEKIKKAKEQAKKKAEKTKTDKPKTKPTETKKYGAITVSYDDLMRNNEKYVGKTVYYKGEIVQVQNIRSDNYILRIAVSDKGFFYDDIIWVNYKGPRVLERDVVDVYGIVIGLKTYTAILNNEITIPEINAKEISIVIKSGDR